MKNIRKTIITISTLMLTVSLTQNPSQAQNRNSEARRAAKEICYQNTRNSLELARCIKKVNKAYNHNPRKPRSDWSEERWQRYEERLQRNVDGVIYRGN